MNNLLFWVVIGIVGLILYISPGFLIYRMYESFAAPAAQPLAQPLTLSPSPPPQSTNQNAIANLLDVLNTPPPLNSPTAPEPVQESNSGRAVPREYETTRSRPEAARTLPGPSQSLEDGKLFNKLRPRDPQPGLQGMLGSMGTQPRIPVENIVYVERPSESPGNNTNPNCPDMRDYIRKDSIPCWGCKLS